MIMKKFALIVLFLLTFALVIAPGRFVSAQQPTPSDDEVNAIAHQLYCPVCENTPLDVCPTTACHQWRELIRQMLADGKTPAEIKQYFVDYYGARVLSEPPITGINWLIYVVPPLAFLIGAFLLFFAFRTWKRSSVQTGAGSNSPQDSGPESPGTADDPYISRLEEELKKRD
jgi:cytochrome c-type biogenesis protein CcmH